MLLSRDGGPWSSLWGLPAASLASCEHRRLPAACQELVWWNGISRPPDRHALCVGGKHGLSSHREEGTGILRLRLNNLFRLIFFFCWINPIFFLPGVEQTFASTRQSFLHPPVRGGSALSVRKWRSTRQGGPDFPDATGGWQHQHEAEERAGWASFLLGVSLHPRPRHCGTVHIGDILVLPPCYSVYLSKFMCLATPTKFPFLPCRQIDKKLNNLINWTFLWWFRSLKHEEWHFNDTLTFKKYWLSNENNHVNLMYFIGISEYLRKIT